MKTIQVVLDSKLLQATERAARRAKLNRSALICDALREYLKRLRVRELEERDRKGYEVAPPLNNELSAWGIGGRLAGGVAKGDLRLYQFAAPDKRRPVVVRTRDSAIPYLSTVTVAQVTSTIRGVPSEVLLDADDGRKGRCAVNLYNAVTVSQQRLGKRVARLGARRMSEICSALHFSLGCDSQ